ncbi:MAG: hypothetical protein HYT50_01930 [Candidatus Wildermuthbacteria bacterium]|nr:hypothetical protein [Candidatus Wildermuthbacteria bacterium]
MAAQYEKISSNLLSGLDARTKDVLAKRFGLFKSEPLTLERIGQEYDITRERVRQIVEGALAELQERIKQEKTKAVLSAFEQFQEELEQAGHLKKEDVFVQSFGGQSSAPHVVFLLNLGEQFSRHKETDDIHPFWSSKKEMLQEVPEVLDAIFEYLDERKDTAHVHELKGVYKDHDSPTFSSMLDVSKHIVRSLDGKVGLKSWPHVYPKTIRDKAYLALKYVEKPLHFTHVAKIIDDIQVKLYLEKRKIILPQTVHNELIKDKRFVLVGRGTYALAEWGYKQGTVKDIISSILKGQKKGLVQNDIVKKTLEQRHVKESTVLLNLQDRDMFAKDQLGRYYLK